MEYLATEFGTNPEKRVGERDNTGQLVSALPTDRSVEVVDENPTNDNAEAIGAGVPEPDAIVDLVQGIESLKKDDALARLLELEDDQEKTFFEIGGILSTIQKQKWFDPHASLDGWVKNNTGIKRSKARALIQIYDSIVKSGVTWARVKHLEWTKLNAIAGILNGSNADHWIEVASNHNRAEIKKLVQEHLAGSVAQKPGRPSDTQVKIFKFNLHDDRQLEVVVAAIDAAKEGRGLPDDSSALAHICKCYMRLQWRKDGWDRAPDGLAGVFAQLLNRLDKKAAGEILDAVYANLAHDFQS
jgi:hypothetical protein